MQTAPERKTNLDRPAVALLLACCVLWGFTQVLVKATLPELAPVFQAALRFCGATLCLWAWCAWRGIALFKPDGSAWPGLVAGSFFALEMCLIYLALSHTTASRATVFIYTSPFWVALLLPLLIPSERLNRSQWLGLLCAFTATALAFGENWQGGGHWLGDALALGAGAAWGATTLCIRASVLVRIAPEKLLFYQVAFTALALPLLSLYLGEPWVWHWSAFAWGSLLVQTVLAAFASYLVWMWLLGRYPATKLSAFVFLAPVFALLFGALWLGEPVTWGLLLSLAGVTAGIVLVNRR